MKTELIKIGLLRLGLSSLGLFFMVGCLQGGSSGGGNELGAAFDYDYPNYSHKMTSSVNFKLTDTSDDRFAQIMVNVQEVEVILVKANKGAKVIVAQNVGFLNLLDFRNGLPLNLSSIEIPDGVFIREIRLRLEAGTSYIVHHDGSICPLQTPSASQSGFKLKLPDSVKVQAGFLYNIVADFNSHKQIVVKGNGGCLLKPVLKLYSATRTPADDPDAAEEPIDHEPDPNNGQNPGDGSNDGVPPNNDTEPNDDGSNNEEDQVDNGPMEGIDYILEGDTILIPQPDGSYIVIEGVDLSVISIEEILSYFQ